MNQRKPLFEHTSCPRCGGSGRYSYCQAYGDTCFQCSGRGHALTKRGKAAQAWLNEQLEVAVSALQVGDTFRDWDGCVYRVEEITRLPPERSGCSVNGVMVEQIRFELFRPKNEGRYVHYYGVTDTVTRVVAGEERARLREAALAYQATLTKAGKPRKQKAA